MKHSASCKILFFLIIPLTWLSACQSDAPDMIRIGVSQCSDDDWRRKLNREIQREMLFHDDAELEILTANDDNEKQISDIRHFIDEKVDVIIAAPNEAAALSPVLKEAYDSGIPVVIFDRGVEGDSYTSYIEFDNYGIGESAATYACRHLPLGSKIIEITGLTGSTPARKRHDGFSSALSRLRPDLQIAASVSGSWKENIAQKVADSLLRANPDAKLIYAHNDLMAIGASKAASKLGKREGLMILGTDAAPNVGIQAVQDSIIDVTFIYPTDGHRLVETAMTIAHGGKVDKNILSPALPPVDRWNADILRSQYSLLKDETEKILKLKEKNDEISSLQHTQASFLYLLAGVVLLLVVGSGGLLWAYVQRQRYEKILKQKNAQLAEERDKQADLYLKLDEATRSKLAFFTNVSHDLRTPLALIKEPVEQIASRTYLNESDRTLTRLALKNVNILRRLIDQILDFRKYETGKAALILTETDIYQAVKDWTESFRTVAGRRNIKLSIETHSEGAATLAIDIDKIERVFFNLLSNAFKYSPDRSCIKVVCSIDSSQMRIEVNDTGYGIKKEDIEKIFDQFYSSARVHAHGSGIGLSVAKAFIELHGGSISVESREGEGSCFKVELPVRHVAESADALVTGISREQVEAELASIESAGNTLDNEKDLILVIDDNPDITLMMQELLSEHYNVIVANDGKQGLRLAAKYVPDLVVCDIMMPRIDGIECCRMLKEETSTSHIPVLMLTASTLDEQRAKSYRSGADGFLYKPFNTDVMMARISSLLENRRKIRDIYGHSQLPEEGNSGAENKRDLSDLNDSVSLESDFYRKFLSCIKQEYANSELDTEKLGLLLGLGSAQLTRKIKALTGLSPIEILKNYRLKQARTQLLSTEKNISEIAYEVGFSSPPYLSKCFREAYGISPSDFRKK